MRRVAVAAAASALLAAVALLLAPLGEEGAGLAAAQFGFRQMRQPPPPPPATGDDFYKILGLSKGATPREIKKANRQLSQKYHPDKNKNKPEAEREKAADMYTRVGNAHEVLSDPEKRKIYDQHGHEGLKRHAAGQNAGGPQNPFDMFFGGGGGGGGGGRDEKRGVSLKLPLFVTLKDVYVGAEFEVDHAKQILCPHCGGSGARDSDDVAVCTKCKGSGQVTHQQQVMPGFVTQTQRTCDKCGGQGKIVTAKCPHCRGRKVQQGQEQIVVLVEPGMPEGHEIEFTGEGDQRPDEIPGDLTFAIRTVPDRRFTRHGNDLRLKLTISLLDALVGFTKEFQHLDGHAVKLERSGVSKPGDVMTLPGEGMPVHGQSGVFGTLFVDISIKMPNSLNDEQKDLARKMLAP